MSDVVINNDGTPVLEVDRTALAVKPEEAPLTQAQKTLVAQIAKGFDPVADPQAITKFGLVPTQQISALADPVLKLVRGKDAPLAAGLLDQFAKDAGKLDFKLLKAPQSNTSLLPKFLADAVSNIAKFQKQVETLDKKMDHAKAGLVKDQNTLTIRTNTLWGLERQVLEMIMQLRCYVFAADVKLNELRSKKSAAQALVGTDPTKQQEVLKLQGLESRLTARKQALLQMGQISVQQLYGIRAVLENSVGLLDMIAMNIEAVDTVWKTQVVLALSAWEQSQIAKSGQNVAANLGHMINATADMIGETLQDTATLQNTGIVNIEALETANTKMIQNVQDYFRLQNEGIAVREAQSNRIIEMKGELVKAVDEATKAQATK